MKYCTKCGQQVNDEAIICPFCSQPLMQHQPPIQSINCTRCGVQLPPNYAMCPYCGQPTNERYVYNVIPYAQPAEKKKGSKAIWFVVIISLILIVGLVGWIVYDKMKENEEKEERADKIIEYHDFLASFYNEIAKSGNQIEDTSILILKVWKNSIYHTEDPETDKYTRKENGQGDFYDDFNESLKVLFNDPSFKDTLATIKEHQKNVDKMYRKLTDPPTRYKDAYEAAKDLYSAYSEFCECAINPTGNYQQATDKHNTTDKNCVKYLNELYSYLEDED